MVFREKDKLSRMKLEERHKPKPIYDLSLVPYFVSKPLPGHGMNEVVKGYYARNLSSYGINVSYGT